MRKTITFNRRQILRGTGGFVVGLPFLESLAAPRLCLAEVRPPVRKRLAVVKNHHGNLRPQTLDLKQPTPRSEQLFAGHTIHAGDLAPRRENGQVVFSEALQAPADRVTYRLLGKMNVYQAIDVPFFTDHTKGGPLGNFAETGDPSEFRRQDMRETIDNVLGWSKNFYSDLTGIRERVLLVGTLKFGNEYSWRYTSPATKTGDIVFIPGHLEPGAAWDSLFRGFDPKPENTAPRAPAARPIIDLVLEDYKRIRQSDRRLSEKDRQRLDDHVERLHELERKVNDLREPPNRDSCTVPQKPDLPCRETKGICASDPKRTTEVYVEMIAAAFFCGLTRLAVFDQAQPFVANFSGDWHQNVAHAADQKRLAENNRNIFNHGMVGLAAKLDVEEAGGRTYLDNSLVWSTNENGYDTHWSHGVATATFGSAGGFLRTGQFIDFRRDQSSVWKSLYDGGGHGITMNQWLAIILQSMGLPRSEFEVGDQQGYGRMRIGQRFAGRYVPEAISQASRVPELLRA